MDPDVLARYVRDLGCLIKERALEARFEKEANQGSEDIDYLLGRLMAFHEVVSLMQEQAVAFAIGFERLCLDDVDPEKDLV